jgi:N utilization substance protein A
MFVQKRREVFKMAKRKKNEPELNENKIDIKAFKKAIDVLEKEKGISEDVIFEALELALTSACKKNYHTSSRVEINRETGEIKVFSYKTVVDNPKEEHRLTEEELIELEKSDPYTPLTDEELAELKEEVEYDPRIHLYLDDAKKIVPDIKVGETIETEVKPREFGRVAASTAKQVIVQKVREAERANIMNEFSDKQDEMVTGLVSMEDVKNYYIDLGKTQGILPKSEIIPGETIKMGSSIKVYITKVDSGTKGPLILLSRKHYGFVKRLFELEIPEVRDGIILIYSVARDAGNRTKIAVYSENPNVEAVGSCIGERGSRINNIIKELNGEKIDVVEYSNDSARFIENALSPAKNLTVVLGGEKENEALVIVDDENLSLAIGKKGQNVRLAARLTHHKIDVKTRSEAREMGINIL